MSEKYLYDGIFFVVAVRDNFVDKFSNFKSGIFEDRLTFRWNLVSAPQHKFVPFIIFQRSGKYKWSRCKYFRINSSEN